MYLDVLMSPGVRHYSHHLILKGGNHKHHNIFLALFKCNVIPTHWLQAGIRDNLSTAVMMAAYWSV